MGFWRAAAAFLLLGAPPALPGPPADRDLAYYTRSLLRRLRGSPMRVAPSVIPPPPTPAAPAAALPELPPEEIAEAREARPPLRFAPLPGERSFDLRGNSRLLAEQVLRAFGVDVIFDVDFQPSENLRLKAEKVEFAEAVAILQAATGAFLVPVSEKLALVAKDTQAARQQIEHTMALAIPLPETVATQDAVEMARTVQQLMEIQKFGVDGTRRIAVMKDRVSKVLPAALVFEDLLRHKAQVYIEVELLETSATSELDLGFHLPTRANLIHLTSLATRPPNLSEVAQRLARFLNPLKYYGLGLADSQLFAAWSENAARTLNRAEVRAVEGQAVAFHIGDRYPVLTAGYFGAVAGVEGEAFRPPPTVNFEDLGVVLKITPRVHEDEVTLEIESEYKVLGGETLNGIPVISNRKFNTSVRLRRGEHAVVAGLSLMGETRAVTGIAGLSRIPLLGHLFRHSTRARESGQRLLVIRPRILSDAPMRIPARSIYVGPEGRPVIPL